MLTENTNMAKVSPNLHLTNCKDIMHTVAQRTEEEIKAVQAQMEVLVKVWDPCQENLRMIEYSSTGRKRREERVNDS
jgi:hypothetical protein